MGRICFVAVLFLISSMHEIAFADEGAVQNSPENKQECLQGSCTKTPAQLFKELGFKEDQQAALTYKHIPANVQALACSASDQQADCKMYMAGFADTVAMMYAMNSNSSGVCGDTSDLMHEFIHAVQENPKAREAETHKLLFALLAKNHSCKTVQERGYSYLTVGSLIDICKAGDIGYGLCSQYEAGFISALLFISERTETAVLCGDRRLINSVSLSNMLNEKQQEDYKVRRDSAVKVMSKELMSVMPCSNQ